MGNQSLSTMDGLKDIMSKLFFSSRLSDYSVQLHDSNPDFSSFPPRFWVIDSFMKDSRLPFDKVLYLEANEKKKNLRTCENVLSFLSDAGCTRHDSIGVIGGGFTQDIGTIVSSLYMRGIRWFYFPTTLMAMLDSCIGGKSSINVRKKKNLVGNFYPPKEIHIFPEFIQTLSTLDIAAGLLEGVKICYARDPYLINRFGRDVSYILEGESDLENVYRNLISQTLEAKKWFLEIDEFDTKERQLLNFGHTFGHALESSMSYRIPHGIAVGFGMLAAFNFAQAQQYQIVGNLEQLILDLISFSGYKVSKELLPKKTAFFDAFTSDKKHTVDKFFLILPTETGLSKVGILKSEFTLNTFYDSVLKVMNNFR